MTKEQLASYVYLRDLIERQEEKIIRYERKESKVEHDHVKGSMDEFPYTEKSFHVSGFNISEETDRAKKIRKLTYKLRDNKQELEEKELEVDIFFEEIKNPRTKLIFEYYYKEGLTEEEIGKKLFLARSTVGRIMDDYLAGLKE